MSNQNLLPATRPQLSPLKRYGGKAKLARRIAGLLPPHRRYVEPFAGAASLLFFKSASQSEIISDADPDLILLWRVIRDDLQCKALHKLLNAHANTEDGYNRCREGYDACADPVERAYRYYVLTSASFNGIFAGGWSRPSRKSDLTAFPNRVARLPQACARLKDVTILADDAIKVIEQYDSTDTLHYLDPPYVHGTRTVPKRYSQEMSDIQHMRMLAVLQCLKGMIILSGYSHWMYESVLRDWHRVAIPVIKHAGSAKVTAEEVLWLNPACSSATGQRICAVAA